MAWEGGGAASARVWARIDLDAVQHNVRQIKQLLTKGAALMAVVKDNAYGHGAVPVARAALAAGAQYLAVGDVEEGLELREAGLAEVPILVLNPVTKDEYRPGIEAGLTFALSCEDEVILLAEQTRAVNQGRRRGLRTKVHLMVDTGMGRAGFAPEGLWPAVERVRAETTLELDGVFTHFSSAEEPDAGPTREQIQLFRGLLRYVEEERGGKRFRLRHAANSAATVFHPEAQLDLVRCGVLLHGLRGWPAERDSLQLRPALSLHTRILHVGKRPPGWPVGYNRRFTCQRDTVLATLATGYGAGYARELSGRAQVLVRGRRLPVAGTISMDLMVADVTPLAQTATGLPEAGEQVTLIGSSTEGTERITAEDLAALTGSIPYVITTTLPDKVQRVYAGGCAEQAASGELPMVLRAMPDAVSAGPKVVPEPQARAAAGA